MFLRTTARANKDGWVVRYLALAHDRRGAATKANMMLDPGGPPGLRRAAQAGALDQPLPR